MTKANDINERELDARIALAFFNFRRHESGIVLNPEATKFDLSPGVVVRERDKTMFVPDYSTDIKAAMQVEDRIAELGLQNDYIAALWKNRDHSVNFWTRTNMESLWAAIHATPRERCEAALSAIEGK